MGPLSSPADDGSLSPGRHALGWTLAMVGGTALTAILAPLQNGPTPTFESMLYLTLAVACALVGGRWPALAASAFGFVALNYFFTEPLHTLTVANRWNLLTLALFVLVSVAVSSVVDSAARRRAQAVLATTEANTLAMLNERILRGDYNEGQLLRLAEETFGATKATIVPAGAPVEPGVIATPMPPDSVLVLAGALLGPADERVLSAFATHVGVLREREELDRQTAAARQLEAGNRTRTALIAAVSHDLRTPLAGIRAAAETLKRLGDTARAGDRAELLTAIVDSSERLTGIVTDLLDMSRLQTGAVTPVFNDVPLDDVVAKVLDGLSERDRVTIPAPLPTVRADAALLERVLENLLVNALGHTDGPVELAARATGPRTYIAVTDHGSGVPADQRQQIFEPFQRLGDRHVGEGVGLGLAVARGLTEAQGGTLGAEDTPGGGLTMQVDMATS